MAETTEQWLALGRRIAELRTRLMSQRELARRAHLSPSYPRDIENGRTRPSPEVLQSIATVIGADYYELAALARYVEGAPGDEIVSAPPDKARILRPLARLPEHILNQLLVMGTALWMSEPPNYEAAVYEGEDADEENNNRG